MAHIDRDNLLKDISESVVFSGRSGIPSAEVRGANKVIDRIKSAPAADVAEVVRCKDCKYCEHSYPAKAIGEEALEGWYCNIFRQWRKPDDFCSYGERRETDAR